MEKHHHNVKKATLISFFTLCIAVGATGFLISFFAFLAGKKAFDLPLIFLAALCVSVIGMWLVWKK